MNSPAFFWFERDSPEMVFGRQDAIAVQQPACLCKVLRVSGAITSQNRYLTFYWDVLLFMLACCSLSLLFQHSVDVLGQNLLVLSRESP